MGVDVELQTEFGETLDAAPDPTSVLSAFVTQLDKAYVHLSAIDPYGDTTFNRQQLPRLLDEISDVRPSAPANSAVMLDAIEQLARAALKKPHLYVKFIGD